tara:strand:+ start:31826 stop:33106 length:1281 start_codon:yes stop_codon:yes gene_type:complete
MSNKTETPFIIYSTQLDAFVKIHRLMDEEIDRIFQSLDASITNDGYTIESFLKYICNMCVVDYVPLVNKHGNDFGTIEALYAAVLEIYPMLTIDSACMHLNLSTAVEKGFQRAKKQLFKNSSAEEDQNYSLKKILKIKKKITDNLIGQDEAVDKITDTFKLMNSGFATYGSAFFIGPTGCGKTELARLIASNYFDDSTRLLKINCSEYAQAHEYAKLIGSPPGYVGSNESGILTDRAEQGSNWVILFDEIEKANEKLHNLLLGFLDEGVITDNKGKELDFTNSIFLFTSNIGIKDNVGIQSLGFEGETSTYASRIPEIEQAFKKEFSPEFINRIDDVIFFNELTKDDAEKIVKLNLKKLPIKITKKLVSHIVDNSYSPEYGARNIKRYIKQNVTLKLADKILSGCPSKLYKPRFKSGQLQIEGIQS